MWLLKGIDSFLSQSLELIIRENLGNITVGKIETRLFEKYGMSLTESLVQFQKLDIVLREFFGAGADGLEEKFFKNVCSIKHVKNKDKRLLSETTPWITIHNPVLIGIILEAFGDTDKKKIIASVTDESKIVYNILKECKIPQTSGYRKINSLIKNGLLLNDESIQTPEGKKINKYQTIFQNVKINIIKNNVTVDIQMNKKSVEISSIIPVMNELKC